MVAQSAIERGVRSTGVGPDDTSPDGPSPRTVLGLLGGESRRLVVASLILGAGTIADIRHATELADAEITRALERLVDGGLVERGETGSLQIVSGVFEDVARLASKLRSAVTPEDLGATGDQIVAMRNWMTEDGRLKGIPAQRAKRLPILDFLAGRFEPGTVYSEGRVNLILGEFHQDTAAWRRHLVDEEFLERRDGFYWRAGGTFLVDDPSG
jgi:hypothetical protein